LAAVITRLNQISAAPLVFRAASDLENIILPSLDGQTQATREIQADVINSVQKSITARSDTLRSAAQQILDDHQSKGPVYKSISSADAVILYAQHFYPQWAGAIAIDLLPAILVFILAITQNVIRKGTRGTKAEDRMTLSDLKSAMAAIRDVEDQMASSKPSRRNPKDV
jgi:hypothetical protein